MINISSTFRSPKKTKQEMQELLTIINVFKKNQKIYLKSNLAPSNIQYEEPSQIVTDLPPIKKTKQKSNSSEMINLKSILENWQAKQLYIKDNIVSQNISKNLIGDYYCRKKLKSNVTTSQKQYHSQRIVKPDLKLAPLKFKNLDSKPKSTLGSLTKKMFAPEPQVYMPPIKLPPIIIPKSLENSA